MEYLIIVIANILIGGMIGLTGIAGFLLPMLYSGFLGMSTMQGLALSFFAFLISGVLGAYNYYRAKKSGSETGGLDQYWKLHRRHRGSKTQPSD